MIYNMNHKNISVLKIDVPEKFYNAEIKNDYQITSEMKRVWAVQMDLLAELDRVCQKYGITYYADSGTLIGAIRHKGYIPWDDDIDIVMKREDYNKLLEVGADEFKSPYFLQNAYSECFIRGFSRLRNSETTAIIKNDIRLNCNKGIFIDIFPLDNVPEGVTEKSLWCKMIRLMFEILRVGVNSSPCYYTSFTRKALCAVLNGFFKIVNYKSVFRSYEKLCSRYNKKETAKISYVGYSFGKKRHLWDHKCFDSSHKVPFEFMEINIPDGYDSRLKTEYGDYMVIKHAPTAHGNVILDPNVSYIEYLEKYSEKEILGMIEQK